MKTVTRKSLNELAKIMPVISEMNQKMYLGGTSGSTGAFDESGTTGYTGVPDITGSASGPIIYDGGWTGSAGGSYGGYGNSDSSGSTSGTTGVTGYYGTSGYDSGFTGSYTGAYDGSSGCLNNSGNSYYYPNNGNSNPNPNFPNNGSSYNNGMFDSGSTYTSDNPCSYDDYCIQMSSGTWGGGFVQGVGYVGSSKTGNATDDVAINGSSRFTSTFDFESRGWKLVENVGITMQFNIKGGVVIENGIIMVSAAGICRVNGAVFSGQIDLLVNGSVVESQLLQSSPGGSFVQGGYQEIGSASFNKAKYGYANVQVRLIASYNNGNYDGTGFWAPEQINEIVYSSNK